MNKFNVSFLIFIAASLTLISGCTMLPDIPFDSNTPHGTGIVIESFRTNPEVSDVYSNEEVTFVVKFKNTGTQRAENTFAEVLGLDQMWRGAPDAEENPQNQEVFPYEPECRYDSTGRWVTLLPPDPSSGIEGGDKICSWGYIAPEIFAPYADYKPRVRIFYDYKSFLIKSITIVPKEELSVLQNQGKGLPVETDSKSGAPISLDLESRSPIRTQGQGQSITFPITINIENVGGGTVCSDSERCRKYTEGGSLWNQFMLTIELPDGIRFDEGSCTGNEDIYLVAGKSQTITCKLRVDIIPERITQKNIRITAEYGYFIDKTIDLRLLPSG